MNQKVLQILIPSNEPTGFRVVSLGNWNARIFIIPRGKLKEIKGHTDIASPGVYFLFGDDKEQVGKPVVYIGESDKFYDRLNQHDISKDYWNVAIVFTALELDKADVRFLEHKSIALAKQVGRYQVKNSNQPQEGSLSEFKKAVAQEFLDNLKFVLSTLGFPLFDEVPQEQTAQEKYYIRSVGTDAVGALLENGQFVVFKKSFARIGETPSFAKMGNAGLKKALIAEGILKKATEESYSFTEDYVFTSPSQAAEIVMGRSADGWLEWKDANKKTLDENKRK